MPRATAAAALPDQPKKHNISSDQGVSVEAIEDDNQVVFKAHNTTARYVHVVVTITGDNLEGNAESKQRLLAPREENIDLGTTRAAELAERWSFRWDWTMTFDDPFAEHDDSVEYVLPFDRAKRLYCCQGVNGKFSHLGNLQYAIDWKARQGTEVLAARGGMVTRLQDDSQESGPLAAFKDKANFVSITHSDHTVGEYVHLKYRGVPVKLGDRVEVGQVIGYSGNTGWSSTPHIHFHVFKSILYDPLRPENDRFRTLPIKFAQCPWLPVQGDWCPPCITAAADGLEVHKVPEQEPETEYRSNGLVIYQYARGEDALELRVKNEKATHAKLTVEVTGDNIEISRPAPVTDIVPALTERYLVRVERTAESAAVDSVWTWNFTFDFLDKEAKDLGCNCDGQLRDFYNMFQEMDAHENGYIGKNEYWDWLNNRSTTADVAPSKVDTLWNGMDVDGNGIIEFAEFLAAACENRHRP